MNAASVQIGAYSVALTYTHQAHAQWHMDSGTWTVAHAQQHMISGTFTVP